MNEVEHRIFQRQADVKLQEIRVAEARESMERGYEKLKADFELAYSNLKRALDREMTILEKEKASLELSKCGFTG